MFWWQFQLVIFGTWTAGPLVEIDSVRGQDFWSRTFVGPKIDAKNESFNDLK